jgi:hypothetical protein
MSIDNIIILCIAFAIVASVAGIVFNLYRAVNIECFTCSIYNNGSYRCHYCRTKCGFYKVKGRK